MAAQLEITTHPDSDDRVVVVGELDTHTAPQLAEFLARVDAQSAVKLDLAATTFISSAGLSAILSAQRRQVEAGGSLIVDAVDANVARTIEFSGLSETLGIRPVDDDS